MKKRLKNLSGKEKTVTVYLLNDFLFYSGKKFELYSKGKFEFYIDIPINKNIIGIKYRGFFIPLFRSHFFTLDFKNIKLKVEEALNKKPIGEIDIYIDDRIKGAKNEKRK